MPSPYPRRGLGRGCASRFKNHPSPTGRRPIAQGRFRIILALRLINLKAVINKLERIGRQVAAPVGEK
jgi:hypothetical protein